MNHPLSVVCGPAVPWPHQHLPAWAQVGPLTRSSGHLHIKVSIGLDLEQVLPKEWSLNE